MAGKMTRANRLQVGYFAQHQVDELEPGGTPYTHVAERMRGEVIESVHVVGDPRKLALLGLRLSAPA